MLREHPPTPASSQDIPPLSLASVTMSDHARGQPWLSWDQPSNSGCVRPRPALSANVAASLMGRKVSCPYANLLHA